MPRGIPILGVGSSSENTQFIPIGTEPELVISKVSCLFYRGLSKLLVFELLV